MNNEPESQDGPPIGMFLVLVALVAGFLAFWHLRPHAKPVDDSGYANSTAPGPEDKNAEMKRWADQMRRDYVETYGKGVPEGMTPDEIQSTLRGELKKMQSSPAFSEEQRAKMSQMLEKSVGK